ncbi:leucine-rich repeat receptor-like protein kinase TDR [Beta vulgaris subsp. vulgaris]|uniref:leucine-rich repeat receptor-like protein kinase TDR n=1 Tax=Beta vulgaris subsp. vulgaris TaxID=3555 RepID=UPI00254705E4|nr:leucine-rich repeat receptor-like protein kinase TDR [Beta vulgaris subsp. vulgaris]
MEISSTLLCLNLLLVASITKAQAADVISDALMSLKSEFTDNYNALSDWFMPSNKNPYDEIAACSWSGVSCNNNSTMIIGLDLSKKGLGGQLSGKQFGVFVDLVSLNLSHNLFSGKLPISIFNLTNLKSLDISRNNFSGNFPNGVSRLKKLVVLDAFSNSFSGLLPAEVSEVELLKVVNFAGSYFSGSIPSEFGNFKSLEFIHLAGNLLGGEIPPELGKLQTLIHMEIGYNSYQGGIPWEIGNMSELHYLDIAGANLSGSIPKGLSNLSKLESLFLFRNQLTGVIPSELSKLISLQSLDLSDNQISGKIPESFSELKNLSLLSLFENELSGTVPKAIADLPRLETLLIWNNFFSGFLPNGLGINSNLILVDVSTNNFSGNIPPNLCANGMLSKLILFSNSFTGELPLFLSNCSSLVRIRFEDNLLSGPISLNFGSLSDISYVDLSSNKLTGGVPESITHALKLEYFNVSNNLELGDALPPKLWSLPVLSNFSATSCNISGNIPPFQSCKTLSVVELSSNHLSGNMPETVTDCQGVRIIDLSHNNLSGEIPEKLGHSTGLLLLNVSFNDISGSIPEYNSFRLMDSSAFVGNPKLCGVPLKPCPNSKEIQNELLWVLILCAAVVVFIALAVSGVYYVHKGRKRGQWKTISFNGLPNYTANDLLKSFSSPDFMEITPYPLVSSPICKVTLPTGITVSVKKIEWDPQRMEVMEELIIQMGNARHKNLTKLLGYCYNKELVYLLYDYVPNGSLAEKMLVRQDWASKYRIILGIAKSLCFLHHDCYPAIPHGDLRSSNIVFAESMEPQLAEFGFRFLMQLNKGSFPATQSKMQPDQYTLIKEELYLDIYNFGKIILEILTNGRIKNVTKSIQSKPTEDLLEEICNENEVSPQDSLRKEVSLVLEVALVCTRSRSSDQPSMKDVLNLLSGSNHRM